MQTHKTDLENFYWATERKKFYRVVSAHVMQNFFYISFSFLNAPLPAKLFITDKHT